MPVIRISLNPGHGADADTFRAFADEVVKEFRNDFRVDVSDAALSVTTDQVEVETRANQVRRTINRIEPILRRHRLLDACAVTTVD